MDDWLFLDQATSQFVSGMWQTESVSALSKATHLLIIALSLVSMVDARFPELATKQCDCGMWIVVNVYQYSTFTVVLCMLWISVWMTDLPFAVLPIRR